MSGWSTGGAAGLTELDLKGYRAGQVPGRENRFVVVLCFILFVILFSSCSSGEGENTAPTEQEDEQQSTQITIPEVESTVEREPVGEQPTTTEPSAPVDEQNSVTEQAGATTPPAESQPMFDIFQLTDWPGNERGYWSPDGSRILIRGDPDGDGDSDLFVMDADGSNRIQLTDWLGTELVEEWSPDGSRILIRGGPDGDGDGDGDLFVIDADGSSWIQLTDWPGFESGIWSSDGSRILIESDSDSTDWKEDVLFKEDDLFVVDVDGSNLVQLTDWPGDEFGIWSPDDARILIYRYLYDYNSDLHHWDPRAYNVDLFVVDVDGSNLVQLTDWPDDEVGTWFPDGSRILVYGNPKEEQIFDGDFYGHDVDYYMVDVDGSNLVQLTDWPGVEQIDWSPDGSSMLISGVASMGVYEVDVDEFNWVQLTDWPDYIGRYPSYVLGSWSPKGSHVLMYSLVGDVHPTRDIYVVDADWSDWILLTDWPGNERGLWSPDSSQILIHNQPPKFWDVEEEEPQQPQQDVYVVDVDGSSMVQLTDWPGSESGSWSSDGSLIRISGNPDSADSGEDDIFVIRVFSQ